MHENSYSKEIYSWYTYYYYLNIKTTQKEATTAYFCLKKVK